MTLLPEYVIERVRRPAPQGLPVVPGSTPVISFGNFLTARVATLGLNPSSREFLDSKDLELTGPLRRLATSTSLGIGNANSVPATAAQQVIDDCFAYFSRQPYRAWFNRLEPILQTLGTSYYSDTACHLDLAHWATSPAWGGLNKHHHDQLLADGIPFLRQQLQSENLQCLLLNGSGVIGQFANAFGLRFQEIEIIHGASLHPARILKGQINDRLQVFGWSTNIQSSRGVKRELPSRIAEMILPHL